MSDETSNNSHAWSFYLHSDDAWEAMYRDLEQAEHTIAYEQYILENDAAGQRFMELFIRKAQAGLKVFIVCDTFGSALLRKSPLVKRLRDSGGHIYFYHPINPLDILLPWRAFPRTHTKTLLIDSRIAYTGGVCVASRMAGWRDTQMRITGPVVAQVQAVFDALEAKLRHQKKRRLSLPPKTLPFRYLLNRPLRAKYVIYRELTRAIANAQRHIYITTAFFIPNHHFYALLQQARVRGVEVIVIVPEASDVPLADWICLSYIPRLMRAGIRVFHYQKSLLHSKTAVIDDWATVGSTNFDIISFFHNREANLIITEPKAVEELRQHFTMDLRDSVEMTLARWKGVPLWKKIIGRMGRILKIIFRQ